MFVVDDVNSLKGKLDQIKKSPLSDQSISLEKDLIEAASWARRLLENVEKVNFKQYGYTLKTSVRAISITKNPDNLKEDEVIYERDRNISLRDFCSAMVHLVAFNFRNDDRHWLDVTNARGENYQLVLEDFISRLESLVLSRRLVVLALCDLSRMTTRKNNYALTYSGPSFNWLVDDHLPEENQLKLVILDKIFKIEDVPDNALPKLKFSNVANDADTLMTIEFGPHWETGQRVMSPAFPMRYLFDVVREFYREPYDSRRAHNN